MNNEFDSELRDDTQPAGNGYEADTGHPVTEPATGHDVTEGGIIGAVGGAIVGGLAGGPLGAVIGAVVGGAASAAAVDVVDKHDNDIDQTPRGGTVTADDSDVDVVGRNRTSDAEYAYPGDRKLTDDNEDVDTRAGDELPLDNSVPNSSLSSAPNRVFEVGDKNPRDTRDYSDTPEQRSGNVAAEHILSATAPGAQAETDRRVFGGEPVVDDAEAEDDAADSFADDYTAERVATPAD